MYWQFDDWIFTALPQCILSSNWRNPFCELDLLDFFNPLWHYNFLTHCDKKNCVTLHLHLHVLYCIVRRYKYVSHWWNRVIPNLDRIYELIICLHVQVYRGLISLKILNRKLNSITYPFCGISISYYFIISNSAHAKIALLPVSMQNSVVSEQKIGWEQNEDSNEIEFRWETWQWNAPRSQSKRHTIVY